MFWDGKIKEQISFVRSFSIIFYTSRKPQAGDRVLGCIMLGSGLGRMAAVLAWRASAGSGRRTAVGRDLVVATRPEIVDLGIQNIAIF